MNWVIDAGHGGTDADGIYTTGNKKRYRFNSGFEILEGVTNRGIAKQLIKLLEDNGISYKKAYADHLDWPLSTRVAIADQEFARRSDTVFLSIHSNAGDSDISGPSKPFTGIEVYTSVGQTRSDEFATIFFNYIQKHFGEKFRLRSDHVSDGDPDKEAHFYVLRKTDCPAVLFEWLFFQNEEEARYLMSEESQCEIANCMFDAILAIEKSQTVI